jgi:hypothetical protein
MTNSDNPRYKDMDDFYELEKWLSSEKVCRKYFHSYEDDIEDVYELK